MYRRGELKYLVVLAMGISNLSGFLMLIFLFKGAYIYYVITLGGVGGPGSLDYIDYALRGGGG